jgi:hypothetical protein
MAPTDTTERTQTRLADRLKHHFGGRLVDLLELPSPPYEDRGKGQYLVAVLRDKGYDRDEARQEALQIQNQFERDTGYRHVTTVYVISASDVTEATTELARAARKKGTSV